MMITYLTITLLISSLCAAGILLLSRAPARLRFYICLMVLVTWLTPWQLLQFKGISNTFTLPLNLINDFNWAESANITQYASLASPLTEHAYSTWLTLDWLWLIAFTIGLLLFCKDLVSYMSLHKRWIKHSILDNQAWKTTAIDKPHCDIRRINTQAPGMTTGLTKPIIWLDANQNDAEKIRTIVLHELTHIRQHDPYWLWVIHFVQRLFWWNPLVWFTAHYARQQIELSCDEQCKKHLPEGDYQLQLIKLTLQVNKQQHSLHMPTVLQMNGAQAFNLKRIKKLNEEHRMKKRYALVLASLLSLTGWIGLSNATVNIEQPVSYADKSVGILTVMNAMNEQNYTQAKIQLDKLVKTIGDHNVSEQSTIWKLYAGVLLQLEPQNPQITTYLDKALALKDELTIPETLANLKMAQAIAASQERWDKQIDYAKRWFAIANDGLDNKQLLFLTAVSHYKLKQYDAAVTVLNKLVSISEAQGFQPKENWLKLLMANYFSTENTDAAVAVVEKIAMLYPSEKNEELLNDLSSTL